MEAAIVKDVGTIWEQKLPHQARDLAAFAEEEIGQPRHLRGAARVRHADRAQAHDPGRHHRDPARHHRPRAGAALRAPASGHAHEQRRYSRSWRSSAMRRCWRATWRRWSACSTTRSPIRTRAAWWIPRRAISPACATRCGSTSHRARERTRGGARQLCARVLPAAHRCARPRHAAQGRQQRVGGLGDGRLAVARARSALGRPPVEFASTR